MEQSEREKLEALAAKWDEDYRATGDEPYKWCAHELRAIIREVDYRAVIDAAMPRQKYIDLHTCREPDESVSVCKHEFTTDTTAYGQPGTICGKCGFITGLVIGDGEKEVMQPRIRQRGGIR